MKNRIVAIVMALMMLTASIALGEAVPAAVSGEFTGTAKGFGGDVNVTVTLTEGAITAVTAEGADENLTKMEESEMPITPITIMISGCFSMVFTKKPFFGFIF